MVDVRATLDSAVANGVVTEETAAEITARVKATFYARRVLVSALDRDDAEHERLRAWLPNGWVRRKRDDALALLRAVALDLEAGLEPVRRTWTLQRTRAWENTRRLVELAAEGQPESTPAWVADEELEAVLDEVRLDPDLYRRLLDRSLLSALAGDAASAVGLDVSPWAHQAALDHERLQRGLLQPEDVGDWLKERDLDEADLPAVARRLAVLRWAHYAHRGSVSGEVALTLRADDSYAGLAKRAARKRDALARLPSTGDIDDSEVVSWYFRERLGQEVPAALDAWASAHGWRRAADLLRALRAEWLFERTLLLAVDGSSPSEGFEPSRRRERARQPFASTQAVLRFPCLAWRVWGSDERKRDGWHRRGRRFLAMLAVLVGLAALVGIVAMHRGGSPVVRRNRRLSLRQQPPVERARSRTSFASPSA